MRKLIAILLFISMAAFSQTPSRWVVGYVGNWQYNDAILREMIGQRTFTHVIHFAFGVDASGNIFDDPNIHEFSTQCAAFVQACHDSSVKAVFCVFPHQPSIVNALAVPSAFSHSICNVIRNFGYDGVDFDYEDGGNIGTEWGVFAGVLRDSLNALGTSLGRHLSLTIFTFANSYGFWHDAALKADRVSIATYEMSGAFGGWPVTHGYNLYDGGLSFPSSGDKVPSGDSLWVRWHRAGIPDSTLMIASSTGVSTWNGGLMMRNLLNDPRFSPGNGARFAGDWWEDAGGVGPNVGVGDNTNWQNIIGQYAQYPTKHDTVAVAAYKTIDNPGNANDKFISFDDPWMWWKKYDYMKNVRNGGGIMMWLPINGRNSANVWPLLSALKFAISGAPLPPPPSGTFSAMPDTLGVGGGTVVLSWALSNATSAVISPAIGSVSVSGSTPVTISNTVTFTLIAQGAIESTNLTVRIGVAAGSGGISGVVTDNFDRANSSTLGVNWNTPPNITSLGINNNQCNGVSGGGFNFYNATFNDSQYARVVPKGFVAGARFNYVGVCLGGSNGAGYYMKTDGTNSWLIYRSTTGAEVILQILTGVGFDGQSDYMTIYHQGTKVRSFKNGIQVSLDQVDSRITTGFPGVGLQPDNGCYVDNFEAGNLVGGNPPPPPPTTVSGRTSRFRK